MEFNAIHLWYDTQAIVAMTHYLSIFDGREISRGRILDTPSGDCDIVTFDLYGTRIQAISAGPIFKFNPSMSLMVILNTQEGVNRAAEKLIEGGGKYLMPLDQYEFSERYAWVEDCYGLSWQLVYMPDGPQKLMPAFMFAGESVGEALHAIEHYNQVFDRGQKPFISYYMEGDGHIGQAKVNYSNVDILGQTLVLMDHGAGGDEVINEAMSLMLEVATGDEMDTLWQDLSFVEEAEACGWLKDRHGVSWQLIPKGFDEVMGDPDPEVTYQLTQAILSMKKIDLEALTSLKKSLKEEAR